MRIAREESDFASEQFMQWFIKEQVEEVATMNDLLAVVTRARDDLEDIEEYVAREQSPGSDDPTAPRAAGAYSQPARVVAVARGRRASASGVTPCRAESGPCA